MNPGILSRSLVTILAVFAASSWTGCKSSSTPTPQATPGIVTCSTEDGTFFTLSGTATYDWIPAQSPANGGPDLDYSATVAKPVRRAIIRAMNSAGAILVEGRTDDSGNYSLNVPGGCGQAYLLVLAKAQASGYVSDGISPDVCAGASWDVRVVDNTNNKAVYAMKTVESYSASASNISIHGSTEYWNNLGYQKRVGAPFAILDTIVTEMELVCGANPSQQFPLIYLNWSASNDTTDGDISAGHIGTSYFTTDSAGISNIYLLGEDSVDTDEYDDHVIAHEYGHYLEHNLFRADSIGGSHSLANVLDPRVAFGEGYGNAISAMTFDNSVYVDTNGSNQATGFSFDMEDAPLGNDRGIYSETSVQHFLWRLFKNRQAIEPDKAFSRIYAVLKNHQASTPGLTTVLSFAAYYNQDYGSSAEGLQGLWESTSGLYTPFDALCVGHCSGSGDTADVFDVDNDIGTFYATGAGQRTFGGSTWGPEFWRVYRGLASGTNASTAHEVTQWGSYSYPINKLGNSRWYTYMATSSGNKTFSMGNLANGVSCSSDVADMYVYRNGVVMAQDETATGCPSVLITATAGETYVIEVRGWNGPGIQLAGWTMTVTP